MRGKGVWTGCGTSRLLRGVAVLSVFGVLALGGSDGLAGQEAPFDVLILNGLVLDGTGNPAVRADVGIRGDRIEAIGRLEGHTAGRTIDAEGLYVTPGFIDIHPHSQSSLASDDLDLRRAYSMVHQGLTTILSGADGGPSETTVAEQREAFERLGVSMNVAIMMGHNGLRAAVMGQDFQRPATAPEVDQMKALLQAGMEEGAFGLTGGLEYNPGRYSLPEEVVELAKVLSGYDGFYIAHQRSEAIMPLWALPSQVDGWQVDGQQGLEETINISRQAGIRVVASHQKARGRASWGRSAFDTVLVNSARAEGLQVYLDVYPYETFGGGPRPMVPAWAVEADEGDGEVGDVQDLFRRRWEDPEARALIERDIQWEVNHNGGPDRVYVLDYPDPRLVNRSLAEIARDWGIPYTDVVARLQLEGFPNQRGGAITRGYGIWEHDIETYLRMDYTAFGSDANAEAYDAPLRPGAHPRHWGAVVRYIARYAKERQTIPLSHAIRGLTGLPAEIVGLRDRGLLKEGYTADVVVFDYDRLNDRATIFEPNLPAEGVEYVMVNGEFTIDEGRPTGALPGRVLTKR